MTVNVRYNSVGSPFSITFTPGITSPLLSVTIPVTACFVEWQKECYLSLLQKLVLWS